MQKSVVGAHREGNDVATFRVNQRVRVNAPDNPHHGKEAVITALDAPVSPEEYAAALAETPRWIVFWGGFLLGSVATGVVFGVVWHLTTGP